ncbi:hypothetical protein IAU59_001163 [Kwoniella sp. CBS 9459]
MTTIAARPQNPHRNSSATTSSSFRDLFTRAPAQTRTPSPSHEQKSNHILPISDFPPQAPRRASSIHDLSELSASGSTPTRRRESFVGEDQLATEPMSNSASPRKSNSVRRKPVPALLAPVPNRSLPVDHPFATSRASSSKSHGPSPSSSARSSPTGGMVVMSVPGRQLGRTPPPPRRSTSSSRAERNPLVPPRSATRPLASHLRNSTPSGSAGKAKEGEQTLKSLDADDALHARMISLSLERPLPLVSPSGDSPPAQLSESPERPESPHLAQYGDSPIQPTTPPTTRYANREPSIVSASTNITGTSRSIDMFEALNASPRPDQRYALPHSPMPGSIPMSRKDASGSGSRAKSRSRIFRWDSTEKAKKAAAAAEAAKEAEEEFSVDRLPSKRNLWEAGTCFLRDEEGELVCFGDFFPRSDRDISSSMGVATHKGKGRETGAGAAEMEKSASFDSARPPPSSASQRTSASQRSAAFPVLKTVVFFIRHFWCGQCQDYTFASLSCLDPVALKKAGIRVVIISNGSWKIIKSYRKLFNCPFPIYVDGPRRLYQLMGMTKMTNDFGPMFKGRAAYHQRPVPTQLLHGLGNAFFRMPLANPGTLTQLGGEFILSPGWNCEFAHRMTNTSDHMEAPDVLRLAGCTHPTKAEVAEVELAESQKEELARLEEEMREWRDGMAAELERIQQKKAARRARPPGQSRANSQRSVARGLDEEIGLGEPIELLGDEAKLGKDNVDPLRDAQLTADQLDERFQRIMRDEELKGKEKVAAGGLMLARGKGELHVEVEAASGP